jgi:DNA-binding NtrC family response regulator
MLVHAFLARLNSAHKSKKHFTPEAMSRLQNHSFPGNVRELQNTVERAFFSSKGNPISDIPLERNIAPRTSTEDVETWFKELTDGRRDFWSAVYERYKRRDISRERVVALVDYGLQSTKGSYKNMASMFRMRDKDYRRFMDFLRRNECLLDFRPYRKTAAGHNR